MYDTNFRRISGICLGLAGLLISAFWILHPEDSLLLSNPSGYQLEHLLGFSGSLLLPLGLVGLYGRLASSKRSLLGIVGFVVAFASALLSLAISTVDAFVWPALARVQPELILTADGHFDPASTVFTSTFPLIITAVLSVMIGYPFFCLALWRAQAVPRPATALLAIAAILSVVAPNFITHDQQLLKLLFYLPLAIALVWLGALQWSGVNIAGHKGNVQQLSAR